MSSSDQMHLENGGRVREENLAVDDSVQSGPSEEKSTNLAPKYYDCDRGTKSQSRIDEEEMDSAPPFNDFNSH